MVYKFYSNITCPTSIEGTTTVVFDCDKNMEQFLSMGTKGQPGVDFYFKYYMLFCRRCNCAIFRDKFTFSRICNFGICVYQYYKGLYY